MESIALTAKAPKGYTSMDPNCAFCGAPPCVGCPCELRSLDTAMLQAEEKVMYFKYADVRTWVRGHSRDFILEQFHILVDRKKEAHAIHMQQMAAHNAYHYNAPPLPTQILEAEAELKRAIDQAWQASLQRYPEVLEYFFSLAQVTLPEEHDLVVQEPPLFDLEQLNKGEQLDKKGQVDQRGHLDKRGQLEKGEQLDKRGQLEKAEQLEKKGHDKRGQLEKGEQLDNRGQLEKAEQLEKKGQLEKEEQLEKAEHLEKKGQIEKGEPLDNEHRLDNGQQLDNGQRLDEVGLSAVQAAAAAAVVVRVAVEVAVAVAVAVKVKVEVEVAVKLAVAVRVSGEHV
ncbi:hypothetical protein E4U31_002201 [Claviceps sp. LM219 group G6]|nr:hypothetical protein E4U31_002201 [Claviceps sp. LM219 group G6]